MEDKEQLDRDREVLEATLQSVSLADVVTPSPSILNSSIGSGGKIELEEEGGDFYETVLDHQQLGQEEDMPEIHGDTNPDPPEEMQKEYPPRLNGGARKRLRYLLDAGMDFEQARVRALLPLSSTPKRHRNVDSSGGSEGKPASKRQCDQLQRRNTSAKSSIGRLNNGQSRVNQRMDAAAGRASREYPGGQNNGRGGARGRGGANGRGGTRGRGGANGRGGVNGRGGANGQGGVRGRGGVHGRGGAHGRQTAGGRDNPEGAGNPPPPAYADIARRVRVGRMAA